MAAMATNKNPLACAALLLLLAVVTCEAMHLSLALKPFKPFIARKRDPNEKVFNILSFGAKPGGKKDCSLNIIRAFRAACDCTEKARLLIPVGEFLAGPIIFEGPCKGPGPLIVQIQGNLRALTDPTAYEEDAWILFESINGLVVSGIGTIDGQGQSMWKHNTCGQKGGSCTPFPASIKLNHVQNGIVRNLKFVNSMGFHLGIVLSDNIRARNLHITAPEDSPNTDGIHISQSNMVKIARTVIGTGDDCVGIIQGCTDVSAKKVTCGPGHGFSIGSLGKYPDEKDVRGITITNCTLKGTENGLRIKTWADSPPSKALQLTFQDIIMEDVKHPIIIDQHYGKDSNKPSQVQISNALFSNIRGTSTSITAIELNCSTKFPCQNVHFDNVNFKYTGETTQKVFSSIYSNAKVTHSGSVFPPLCQQ